MDIKRQDLTARNFPTARQDAVVAKQPSLYEGPESAYRLAFTDVDFLLREELRPIRLQLELLKPELVQDEQGVEATIVFFGSARIVAPRWPLTENRKSGGVAASQVKPSKSAAREQQSTVGQRGA